VTPVRLLTLPAAALAAGAVAATKAFPEEACGLLEGAVRPGEVAAVALHLAANVATDRRARFDVDPRALLRLHRETRERGTALVGVWHSHPNGVAVPSATDFAEAHDPSLVWLLTPVTAAGAGAARAYSVGGNGFVEIGLEVT